MPAERKLTDEQIRSVAEQLIGTCEKDIDDICEEDGLPPFEQWTQLDCYVFDSLAFRCDRCNWWHEAGDYAENAPEEEQVCSDCGD